MFKKILCYITLLIGNVFSNPVDFNFEGSLSLEGENLIVSLGSGCDTGITLRECGLRNAAFPFDWLVSGNHKRFITLLDDDFEFFTDERFFVPLIDPNLSDHPNCLMHTYYDILFYHEGSILYDWSELDKYIEQLERMKLKYTKRINRFRQIRLFTGKVFFIRNFTSDNEDQASRHSELAAELRDALRRYLPNVNFTLVIVTYNDVNAPAVGPIDGVVEFKMDRPGWRQEYAKMYESLLNQ